MTLIIHNSDVSAPNGDRWQSAGPLGRARETGEGAPEVGEDGGEWEDRGQMTEEDGEAAVSAERGLVLQ